jgi:hypothetical protein
MAYNETILDLIDVCKNYNYITDLHDNSNMHLDKNILERCRKLKEEQYVYYPLIQENVGPRLYAYKTNQPRIELFGNSMSVGPYDLYVPNSKALNDLFVCQNLFAACEPGDYNAKVNLDCMPLDYCSQRWLKCINSKGLVLDKVEPFHIRNKNNYLIIIIIIVLVFLLTYNI